MNHTTTKDIIHPRGLSATNIPKLKRTTGFANHSCDSIPRIKVTMAQRRGRRRKEGKKSGHVYFVHTYIARRLSTASTSSGSHLFLSLSPKSALPVALRDHIFCVNQLLEAKEMFSATCRRYESDGWRVGVYIDIRFLKLRVHRVLSF